MNLLQNYEKIFILASFLKTKYNNSDTQSFESFYMWLTTIFFEKSSQKIWRITKMCITLHSQNGGIAQLVRASDS